MANRSFNQNKYGLEKGRVELFCEVAVGSTGAPTISVANSKGIASIVRNSAGKYTITLSDAYTRLLNYCVGIVLASGVPSTGSNLQAVVRTASVSSKSIAIEFLGSAGTAAEVVSGATLLIKLELKNSSI